MKLYEEIRKFAETSKEKSNGCYGTDPIRLARDAWDAIRKIAWQVSKIEERLDTDAVPAAVVDDMFAGVWKRLEELEAKGTEVVSEKSKPSYNENKHTKFCPSLRRDLTELLATSHYEAVFQCIENYTGLSEKEYLEKKAAARLTFSF